MPPPAAAATPDDSLIAAAYREARPFLDLLRAGLEHRFAAGMRLA